MIQVIKRLKESEGVGTDVKILFETLGIAAAVKAAQSVGLLSEDCGCEKRERRLNEWEAKHLNTTRATQRREQKD